MATYTVTIIYTRPDTEIDWPQDKYPGGTVDVIGVELNSVTDTFSDDNLTQTKVCIWKSKLDFENARVNDAVSETVRGLRKTYIGLNNIGCKVTEEDGTVKVFNSSNKTFEVQE